MFRILLPTLELETAVVPGQQPRESNEHLPQWWVHIEEELALEIVRTKLSKVRFIPDDDVCLADSAEASPAGEEGVEDRRYVLEVLRNELALIMGTNM